jgi:murein DD-endopeptidase MepM/ murein hydrolase activator NlpD
MFQLDIHIPRPWLTLGLVAAAVMFFTQNADVVPADALGGSGETDAMIVHEAEEDVRRLREKQDVMDRREQILRAELAALEEELTQTQDQSTAAALVAARDELLELLDDRRAAESQILLSLQQIWEAQGVAVTASTLMDGTEMPVFEWPVDPTLGISAHFHDAGYKQRFGMEHQAIDIPVLQGSTVYAAAAGAVVKVSDNGKGYSSLVISHDGGFSTLYGHISGFLVKEGDHVRAGQAVALSGGTPGTNGAGRMTTGAHLHFELIQQGEHVDPLPYLPRVSEQ